MAIQLTAACAFAALVAGAGLAQAGEILTYTGNPFGTTIDAGAYDGNYVKAVITVPVSTSYTGELYYTYPDGPPSFSLSDVNSAGIDVFTITQSDATSYSIGLDLVDGLPVDWGIQTAGTNVNEARQSTPSMTPSSYSPLMGWSVISYTSARAAPTVSTIPSLTIPASGRRRPRTRAVSQSQRPGP